MALHHILVIIVILVIIGLQVYIYVNTKNKIFRYKTIFTKSPHSYSIVNMNVATAEDEGMVVVSQIAIDTQNPTLMNIRDALNMYLQKNKGAASDFYLMKDVVERYCDAKEEEISVQQPIPLYLGLMGTMIGIIVGIGFIAFTGGFSSEALMGNITSLMTCVAIAMAASFVGIFCTTMLSWESKSATTEVEADKNRFYSWLQTELLPVLSGNAVNALYLLQQNLMKFNHTFQTNIEGLDCALSKVTDSTSQQVELISLIKNIDIKRVAQANITVLKELKDCSTEIAVFNKYLHSVSNYLNAVNELNNSLNEHLTRTAAIERMGEFFEREINQVAEREQYINEVVAKVDDTLRKTFEQIQTSTKEGVAQLQNNSVMEFDALLKHYADQKDSFAQMIKEQQEGFVKMLNEQKEEFTNYSAQTVELMKKISYSADIKTVLEQLLESTKNQATALNELATSLKQHNTSSPKEERVSEVVVSTPIHIPNSIIYLVAVIAILIAIALGLYVYNSFFTSSRNRPAIAYITQFKKKQPLIEDEMQVIDKFSIMTLLSSYNNNML